MIKLFRNIRKKLAEQNKVVPYLRYAIGEIALVMIGILLALQVNNWNEKRKQKLQEHKILVSLYSDFKESKNRLLESMDQQRNVVRKSSELIKIYEGKKPRPINDSIKNYIIYGAYGWYRPELLTGAYDAFVNSGNSELISNDNLTKMLAEYFSIVNSGFEDQETSMNLLNNLQTILAPVNVYLYTPFVRNRIGLDSIRSPKEDDAIDFLFKQDDFFGQLIHRTVIEELRYSIQKDMLDKINQILSVLKHEIELNP